MATSGRRDDDLEVSAETLAAFESQLARASPEEEPVPGEEHMRAERRHALMIAIVVVFGVVMGLVAVLTYVL